MTSSAATKLVPPQLALYVHLPWCVKKCPYCDFNSHTAGSAAPKRRYLDALLHDLLAEAERAGQRDISSVFLGGGTPSLFTPQEIAEVIDAIRASYRLPRDVEITMEANPGTVECESPAAYREAGINRLSIGAQSFDDTMLSRLGRIHSSDDIRRTVSDAKAGGLNNFNIDVMHGLPGQTLDMALHDVRSAIELEPAHISWYQLTLEPNTVFYARPPEDMPSDDLAFEIQQQGQARLSAAGYEQYEVSAYARDKQYCRHNLNYWLFGDYLAVGAGAHGKITDDNTIYRYQKPANPMQYMQCIERGDLAADLVEVPQQERVFEFMLNALRLNRGFEESMFADHTGQSVQALQEVLSLPQQNGLIEKFGRESWRPTDLGARFLDDLQQSFLKQ